MKKLKARTVRAHDIAGSDLDRMFQIMQKYYDAVSREQFEVDLKKKTAAILLRDSKTGVIQGFSTLMKKELSFGDKKVTGIFSGDTIIEKEYWGQRSLGIEFLKYLWLDKIKNPFKPLYWFLISKGYKTYLLMSNNFREHYPRYEEQTPSAMRQLMDQFYSSLYPDYYDGSSDRILFESCVGKLKEGVADTDRELIRTNPRVAFFEAKNPGWKSGDELACVARMTFLMPFQYQWKAITRKSAIFAPKPLRPFRATYAGPERRRSRHQVRVERRSRGVA